MILIFYRQNQIQGLLITARILVDPVSGDLRNEEALLSGGDVRFRTYILAGLIGAIRSNQSAATAHQRLKRQNTSYNGGYTTVPVS